MRKRILPLLYLAIVCVTLFRPLLIGAVAADPDAQVTLTLDYQKDGRAFAELPIGIYRVAQMLPDGTFELIEPFASYPINIHGITVQEQWHTVAQTLHSYNIANQVKPDAVQITDAQGAVCFTGLKTGLYFVQEAVAENSEGTYLFNHFLIYLPTPQPDGSYNFDVQAKPKCTQFIPKTQYTVTKLWKDTGNQMLRPKEVTVDIYQDGILQETQVLSAANNWTYTWHVSEADQGQWSVAERDVAKEYKVTVKQNGNAFSIINTCPTRPNPPQTGDTLAPLPLLMIICVCGMLLVVLGLYGRRHQ